MSVRIREEKQINPVADEVLALTAVVRPILKAVLYSLKVEVVKENGGFDNIKLFMLPRAQRKGDGDCGICFEYAVHEAMAEGDPMVMERIESALRLCKVPGADIQSILFGVEKDGHQQLIKTAEESLSNESVLLVGAAGRPPKLKKHLNKIAGAFKNRRTKPALPYSIRGL